MEYADDPGCCFEVGGFVAAQGLQATYRLAGKVLPPELSPKKRHTLSYSLTRAFNRNPHDDMQRETCPGGTTISCPDIRVQLAAWGEVFGASARIRRWQLARGVLERIRQDFGRVGAAAAQHAKHIRNMGTRP